MQTADISGFFRTIIIIMSIYYLIKIAFRYLGPFILRYFIRNLQNQSKPKQDKNNYNKQNVGETVVDKKPNKKQQKDSSLGEYIDFEEVDD
ncbi:MAG: DUF4834 domain-containing protein [Flavobacteriaceae bacterium]|nr:DUF4834 domain-containing protein [Flavobacteriaceae bacterium]